IAIVRFQIHDLAEQLFRLLVLDGAHEETLLDISRYNQAFAAIQSLLTVEGETPSTSAVSSIESPPKKRITTTWLCCSSFAARLSSASSSLMRSMSGRPASLTAS